MTGVKRDISLLKRVPAGEGDSVTVLDISLDKNREELQRILNDGVPVTYFDHHFAGDIPEASNLSATIDTAGDVCTGLLVSRSLNDQFLPWAVTALFGDNLYDAARTASAPLGLDESQLESLKTLGTLLNYNGYGSTIEDLYFAPDELYRKVSPYADPFEFINSDETFATLRDGYEADMRRAKDIEATLCTDRCAMFVFPNDSFSRRVSGVYSNELARDNPSRAHALASLLPSGDYLVSVRAPLETKEGADELCRQFPTGGGRKAAAGINQLPAEQLTAFQTAFESQFHSCLTSRVNHTSNVERALPGALAGHFRVFAALRDQQKASCDGCCLCGCTSRADWHWGQNPRSAVARSIVAKGVLAFAGWVNAHLVR